MHRREADRTWSYEPSLVSVTTERPFHDLWDAMRYGSEGNVTLRFVRIFALTPRGVKVA